jgi:hypothetical protein
VTAAAANAAAPAAGVASALVTTDTAVGAVDAATVGSTAIASFLQTALQ